MTSNLEPAALDSIGDWQANRERGDRIEGHADRGHQQHEEQVGVTVVLRLRRERQLDAGNISRPPNTASGIVFKRA